MKARSYELESLNALQPLEVAAYLRVHGWQQIETLGDNAGSVWQYPSPNGKGFEAILPYDRNYGDYLLRMADLINLLEVVEERSRVSILNDLFASNDDVVRIKLVHTDYRDGTVPIEEGVKFVTFARDLMFEAAYATAYPKSRYQYPIVQQVREYMKGLRFAQTERGSYVLTLHSTVPPSIAVEHPSRSPQPQAEPFGRAVMLTLVGALSAVRTAALSAIPNGSIKTFDDLVERGVSAKLCNALVGLGSGVEKLVIGVHWASVRAVPDGTPSELEFYPDTIAGIAGIARMLQQYVEPDFVQIRGYVLDGWSSKNTLLRDNFTVATVIEGELCKVKVQLEGNAIEAALTAYEASQPIHCEGKLILDKHGFSLLHPTNFRIASKRTKLGVLSSG